MYRQLTLVKQVLKAQNVTYATAAIERKPERKPETKSETKPTSKPIPLITCKNTKFNLMFDENQKVLKATNDSEIELASKGWQHYKAKKDHFIIHPIKNVIESNAKNSTEIENLDLHEKLIRNAREKHDIVKATKLQTDAIEQISKGHNVLIAAETGCGKVS